MQQKDREKKEDESGGEKERVDVYIKANAERI